MVVQTMVEAAAVDCSVGRQGADDYYILLDLVVDIEVADVQDMLPVVDSDIDQVVVVVVVHTALVVVEHIDQAVAERSWQDRHIAEAVHIPQRVVVDLVVAVRSLQHFLKHPLYNIAAAVGDWQQWHIPVHNLHTPQQQLDYYIHYHNTVVVAAVVVDMVVDNVVLPNS